MTADLCEAVRYEVRYKLPDENGETRLARNARFGVESPEQSIPRFGMHLWEWFFDANELRRDHDKPLSASDWKAWQELTGVIVRLDEWRILRKMDQVYVAGIIQEKTEAVQRRIEANQNGGHCGTRV